MTEWLRHQMNLREQANRLAPPPLGGFRATDSTLGNS